MPDAEARCTIALGVEKDNDQQVQLTCRVDCFKDSELLGKTITMQIFKGSELELKYLEDEREMEGGVTLPLEPGERTIQISVETDEQRC